ncbi:MAG TPA: DUF2171 domain-containing protein [Steroidobacteraceae bacterium]
MLLNVIVISAVVGVLLGLHYRVFVLVPAILLVFIGILILGLAAKAPPWTVFAFAVYASIAVQLSYLAGAAASTVISDRQASRSGLQAAHAYGVQDGVALAVIRKQMEVVGSDGRHVGTIDREDDDERIVLSANDPKAGGQPHLISIAWIDHVDDKVHLNRSSRTAFSEWLQAA